MLVTSFANAGILKNRYVDDAGILDKMLVSYNDAGNFINI